MPLRRRQNNFAPRVPSGLIAHTEKGYFLMKGAKRFQFTSTRARLSWGLKTIETTEFSIRNSKVVGFVGFRDGTLIRNIADNRIYFIADNKKMQITDPDVLIKLGYKYKDIILVSAKETALHKDGGILNVG